MLFARRLIGSGSGLGVGKSARRAEILSPITIQNDWRRCRYLSFAMQESFPMKGTYADAAPLGPIMELGADEQNAFTADRAEGAVEP